MATGTSVTAMQIAVKAEGLRKRFGSTEALRGFDLEVPQATVVGLLGPNGAGKTTAVRILSTLLRPDAGHATIDGLDVATEARAVRTRIGLTGQYAAVDERLTGAENLEHVGRLYRLGTRTARVRARELLAEFDLVDAGHRPVRGYSGGMRRRLDIAMSLVARPSVLFLDEPTTGLDPRSRLGMWDHIGNLVRGGTTTVLTTQYLDEAEQLADHIVVIDHGEVIANGTAAELKARVGGSRLTVTATDPTELTPMAEALTAMGQATGTATVDTTARTVTVAVGQTHGVVADAVRCLDRVGIAVDDAVVNHPTLDDVFLKLTGSPAGDNPTDDTVDPAVSQKVVTGD